MSRASKFLSLILRHEPHRVGVTLDANGWTSIDALLAGLAKNGLPLSREDLFAIVRDSDKQRFAISEDGTRIRANQGHSVQIELALPDATPPARLYHGTYEDAVASIHATGLSKGKRHAVHMAAETATATKVGMRKGAPVILTIRADEMVAEGIKFQRSKNGVWLTDHVPARYIDFPSEASRPEWRHWAGSGSKPRTQMAAETDRAVKAGSYTAPSGARVSIAATTELARRRTMMYELGAPLSRPTRNHATKFSVVAESTNQSIVRLLGTPNAGHVCAMNFASAKTPGGGWRGGARAQEESIARASALVACLESQPSYYARNRAMKSAMYLDLVLFSPYVPFFRDDEGTWLEKPVLASIITVAAPNATALRQHGALAPAPSTSTSKPSSNELAAPSDVDPADSNELAAATDDVVDPADSNELAAATDDVDPADSNELDAASDDVDPADSNELAAADSSELDADDSSELDAADSNEIDAADSGELDAADSGELDAAVVDAIAAADSGEIEAAVVTAAADEPEEDPAPISVNERRSITDPITDAELEQTLRRRARLALDACVHHKVDRLILGAWGAGVFGNDPDLIADCFAEPLFGELAGAFVEVVFAILGGPGAANYDAFAKRFPPVGVH
jgi:putative RNA 2'-phosphotransferase